MKPSMERPGPHRTIKNRAFLSDLDKSVHSTSPSQSTVQTGTVEKRKENLSQRVSGFLQSSHSNADTTSHTQPKMQETTSAPFSATKNGSQSNTFSHVQSSTCKQSSSAFSFEELRMFDYRFNGQAKVIKDNASKSFFGLPTAPSTPQPSDSEQNKDEKPASVLSNAATTTDKIFTFSKVSQSDVSQKQSPTRKHASVSSSTESANSSTGNTNGIERNGQKLVSNAFSFGDSPQKREKIQYPVFKGPDELFSNVEIADAGVSNQTQTQPSIKEKPDSKVRDPFKSFFNMDNSLPQPTADAAAPPSKPLFANSKINSPTKVENHKAAAPTFDFAKPPSPKKTFKFTDPERERYMRLHQTKDGKTSGADEQLRTTPLFSLSVKSAAESRNSGVIMFPQYAFLGCRIPSPDNDEDEDADLPEPVLLNTNTPWSAFICGSQGSGKSYTLSAILENCLYPSSKIGKLPKPIAGVVFHNNTSSIHNICEAAHLVSLGVKVNVFVSRSNFFALEKVYKAAVHNNPKLKVQPFVLQSQHLNAERMYRLMAFQEGENAVPLYMEVIMRILREMAMTSQTFNYKTFRDNLKAENLQPGQTVMMQMRLNLLESFLDTSAISSTRSNKSDIFATQPGTLSIVDLSDPFLDSSTVCTLFDIALSLFEQKRPDTGMLVALDEAHKFMKPTPAAETFTEHLLTTIREQRHNATRIVIATQEPTISPKLLDLCSITLVHRFTSPDWLVALRGHLAAASDFVTRDEDVEGKNRGVKKLFEGVINLDVGESLLFAPSAVLDEGRKVGTRVVRFKTRERLGSDGGRSVLAVRE